jgi:hypothetical protein
VLPEALENRKRLPGEGQFGNPDDERR